MVSEPLAVYETLTEYAPEGTLYLEDDSISTVSPLPVLSTEMPVPEYESLSACVEVR